VIEVKKTTCFAKETKVQSNVKEHLKILLVVKKNCKLVRGKSSAIIFKAVERFGSFVKQKACVVTT
jgi:hypothetical protein